MRDWLARHPVLGAALALYAAGGLALWFVCDDAWISFRYGRMWAAGEGVRFNLGVEPPVEGYTNFGWVALAAFCEALGVPPWWVLPALSLVCGAGLVLLVHRTALRLGAGGQAADLAALVLATSPITLVWATGGLATMPFALLIFLAFERLVVAESRASLVHAIAAGIALALLRFEGFAWVVVLGALGALVRGPRRGGIFLGATALGWAPYMAWRTLTYGLWVPNTALAKVGLSLGALRRGARYLAMTGAATLVPPLLYAGLPAALRRGRAWVAVGLMALAVPAYAVAVGGDFMAMGRILVPALPFAALLLAAAVEGLLTRGVSARRVWIAGGLIAAVGLLPLTTFSVLPEAGRRALSVRHGDSRGWTEIVYWSVMRRQADDKYDKGLALKELLPPDATMVAGAIGAVGYASELFIWDEHGLVTPEIARRPAPPDAHRRMPGHEKRVPLSYFLDHEPTVLRAKILGGRVDEGGAVGPPRPKRVKKELRSVGRSAAVRAAYLPELHPWGERWILLVRRVEPGEDPAPAWAELRGGT